MPSIGVNPPKTPVTEGSMDMAPASLPNVCKMPGPPAPFVPTPLPNLGRSGDRLKKGTKKVIFEGKKVALKGSYYMSMGDMASKGTGGGLLSATTHGKTEFVGLGSMNVKAEGKNIQLLGDAMTNNGSSKNTGSTLPGNQQAPTPPTEPFTVNIDCKAKMNDPRPGKKWDKCMCQQLCAKVKKLDQVRKKGKIVSTPGARTTAAYGTGKRRFIKDFMERVEAGKGVRRKFIHKCAADKYMEEIHPDNPTTGGKNAPFNADHIHDAGLGGNLLSMSNFKMMDGRVNQTIGPAMQNYEPEGRHKGQPIKAHSSCNCPHGPE